MYNFKEVESFSSKFWEENRIYLKLKERLKNSDKKFFFIDGPPYATGDIHPGTAWNKTVKDAFLRYFRAKGYNVKDQPGFDTHGLPIEVKVEKLMNIKNKAEIEEKGIENFIKHCKEFANKYIGVMTNQFKSFGIWMDWDNPYITYKDNYIERSWETLKKAYEKGLVEEGHYVIPYCYRCETTLANYELEYKELTDPSIYVKFPVKGEKGKYLIIWTTTPWTLVGNMGVMANPEIDYVEIEVEGERWILAKELVESLMNKIGKSFSIIKEFKGKEMEGLAYEHPFQDLIKKEYDRKVVLSEEFVTLEEGTGLVHMAPGHGPEDYAVGKKYGIEIFCPVDEKGNYKEEAGEYAGKNVREANTEIIEMLDEKGILVHTEKVTHRYPTCWRCKTPLIYITTKQWFIKVSKLKDKMKEEAKKVKFSPKFAGDRFLQFIDDAPDWCISRQRYWGIPLPIWKCKNGHVKVIGSKKELGKEVKELHRPYIDEVSFKCEKCGEEMKRISDVLDVWFDSGNAVWASLSEEEEKYWGNQCDLILEGQDQIRGWFYSLLGSGVVRQDKIPYKQLIMHGFFVDEKGEKMSKSVGNFIPVSEILEKAGADSFRLWGASNTIWEEIKFSWEELRLASRELNIFLNLVSYLERAGIDNSKSENLEEEDKWLIQKVEDIIYEFNRSFKELRPFEGVKKLREFLIEDLSQFYMKIAKKRISENNDKAAKYVLYKTMLSITKMLSIITPHTAEYAYQRYFKKFEKEESIFFLSLEDGEKHEDEMKETKEIVSAVLKLRNELEIKLRWPIEEVAIVGSKKRFENVIKMLGNAKKVSFVESIGEGYKIEEMENGIKVAIPEKLSEELVEEGLMNEIIRRIQAMRKELNLVEKDRITVKYKADEKLRKVIENNKETIASRVNSMEIKEAENNGKLWKIEGSEIKIEINQI